MPLYEDASFSRDLYNRRTGATHRGPWISLRNEDGRVYFANLESRETRWFAPRRWFDDWIARVHLRDASGCTPASAADAWRDGCMGVGLFDDRSWYGQRRLPALLARQLVEGGAPYLYEGGMPQYESDHCDSFATHPARVVAAH